MQVKALNDAAILISHTDKARFIYKDNKILRHITIFIVFLHLFIALSIFDDSLN